MVLWVGDDTGKPRPVAQPWVGDGTGVREIEELWVGDLAGTPRLVWAVVLPISLTVTAPAYNRVELQWTTGGANASYTVRRGTTTIWQGNSLTYTDHNVSGGRSYTYTVIASVEGNQTEDTKSVTTPVQPIQQRYVELTAVSSASYNGSNSNRGVTSLYYGRYSSTQGQQKSLWCWDVPGDVRASGGCLSIDRIDVSVYNVHAYYNSGGTTGLTVHHGDFRGGFPGGFPGSTGVLTYGGAAWTPGTPKPGWMRHSSQPADGWMSNIHVLVAPGRTSLGEEFRVNGAWGMGLDSPTSSLNQYGYAGGVGSGHTPPRIRIWYTVQV